MRTHRKFSVSPRSVRFDDIEPHGLILPMHEGTGVVLNDIGGRALLASNQLTLSGSAGTMWSDVAGFLKPASTNQKVIGYNDATVRAFVRLDTLGPDPEENPNIGRGGMLVMFSGNQSVTPNATENVFNAAGETGYGQYAFQLTSSGRYCMTYTNTDGTSQTPTAPNTSDLVPGRNSFVGYIDCYNTPSMIQYLNGTLVNTTNLTGGASKLPNGGGTTKNGLGLFCTHTSGTASSKLNGSGTPSATAVAEFYMVRVPGDFLSTLPTVAAEFAANKQFPMSLADYLRGKSAV